jgi:hypothetical protein
LPEIVENVDISSGQQKSDEKVEIDRPEVVQPEMTKQDSTKKEFIRQESKKPVHKLSLGIDYSSSSSNESD